MPSKPLVSAVLITRQDGFSNPTSKTGNRPSEASHHLTRTRCLCPKGETSGLARGNPARIGRPDLSLWMRGGGRRDDAYRRNTWRTLGVLRRVSGSAQKKTPRSRISLPWGSVLFTNQRFDGESLTVFEKETETRETAGNLSGPDSHGSAGDREQSGMLFGTEGCSPAEPTSEQLWRAPGGGVEKTELIPVVGRSRRPLHCTADASQLPANK
jgi:hypothetical protein